MNNAGLRTLAATLQTGQLARMSSSAQIRTSADGTQINNAHKARTIATIQARVTNGAVVPTPASHP